MSTRRAALAGAAFAALSIALKLLIVRYGLPYEFNPDEPYILKDPFKLTFLYTSGDFRSPTNLYFWVLQVWYGLVFLGGLVMSRWHNFGEFRNLIVAESEVILLWGRLFAVACSGAAVWILYRVAERTIGDRRLRWLLGATLAVNPIDLVSSVWLKFDGPGMLLNALVVAALVRYLNGHETAARRRLYMLAVVACSFRIDFAAVLAGIVCYEVATRQALRPMIPTFLAAGALYCVITLMPVAIVARAFTSPAPRTVLVSNTFEENISANASILTPATVTRTIGANVAFYGTLLLAFGPALLVALWSVARPALPLARIALFLFAALLIPVLVFPINGTRYLLLPSVYLLLSAGWTLQVIQRPVVRHTLMTLTLLCAASLAAEAIVSIRTQPNPRLQAARYLLDRSRENESIALENYVNQGYHAEVAECPEDLALKAKATREAGLGSGETYQLHSQRERGECRRIIEVGNADRFGRSAYAGRWSNKYDVPSLPDWFSSNTDYGGGTPARPEFAKSLLQRYVLAQAFEPRYADPRLRLLLEGTPFHMTLYVYRRRT
jgi:hypothetical protein